MGQLFIPPVVNQHPPAFPKITRCAFQPQQQGRQHREMSPDTRGDDAPESPIHFHAFPKLPLELRWKIWQMVICTDETPRIHYYSFFNNDNEGHRQSSLQQMMRAYPPEPSKPRPRRPDGTLFTILPRRLRSQPSQCSWTEANHFLYLWDAGLQTACKESRAALLHHRDKATKQPSPKRSDMVTSRHQGRDVYLRVCSKQDIMCFRFSPEDMVACVSLRWDILLTHLPFFHLPHASDINLAFEFHDNWDEGLGMSRESMLKCLPEASHRGLAMRAHWAWMKGEIPRWTRMWLIDRGGRLPANYQLPQEDDGRYRHESFRYINEFPCEPEKNHIFIDGKNRYVESYMWEGQRHGFVHSIRRPEVPILSFIWKVSWLCRPPQGEVYNSTFNLPCESERFFRVLRQLPGTDGTG